MLINLLLQGYHICGYLLANMAIFWMTECIPLPITAFLPIVVFPMTGILTTDEVCRTYMNVSCVFDFTPTLSLYYVSSNLCTVYIKPTRTNFSCTSARKSRNVERAMCKH